MDTVVTAVRKLFAFVTGTNPQFRSQGGSNAENLALQNIQVKVFCIPSEPSLISYIARQDSGWCWLTCLHSFFHGCEGRQEVSLSLEVQMSTKGAQNSHLFEAVS